MAQQSATTTAKERDERARAEQVARAGLTVPPCPDWCERAAGHGYDDIAWDSTPWTFTRTHSRQIGTVEFFAVEQNVAGVVSLWEPWCEYGAGALTGDLGDGLMSSDRLRVVMADMSKAADLLDGIEAQR